MNIRSTSSNLFSPLRDFESLIRRNNLGEPSSLFDFKEVISIPHNNQEPPPAGPPPPNNNGPPPVVRPSGPAPDLRLMEELCQPSINGRGGPIASIPIQPTDFGLHHHMIQQVQNTCQFHGLLGDDADRHIDTFLEVTQHMKQNGVFDDALRLSLFSYSLTHQATTWYDRRPRNSIHTFDDMMRKFLPKYFPPSMVTKLRNKITKFRQDPNESLFKAWERYNLTPFETNDSLLEEFADKLALLDPFPSRNKYDNFDFRADLRKIEYLLNQDPTTESTIETINPILEKFIDKPALDYLPPLGDNDDDVFDFKSDNYEWKKIFYGDCNKDIDSEKDKNKDSKMKSLVVEAHIVESNDLLPQLLDNDSILLEESFEIATLSSSPFENKDNVFNPVILIWGRAQILMMNQKIRIIK
uniref:Reverse transcriptase domain-containing protein n=1 Tax=Tanacetum cinerariifolium TaxID=118510 RepID=A0A699IPD1_TANCI|nr:reverse transcriptase domain-containing protein [Tanacetum cinerariifolium]